MMVGVAVSVKIVVSDITIVAASVGVGVALGVSAVLLAPADAALVSTTVLAPSGMRAMLVSLSIAV